MHMQFTDYLVHFSNILLLVSYSVRDILWLRWFAVGAALINIPYFLLQRTVLWPPVLGHSYSLQSTCIGSRASISSVVQLSSRRTNRSCMTSVFNRFANENSCHWRSWASGKARNPAREW